MTGLLASVRSLEEAKLVLNEQAEIIDLKEPNDGALGAVPSAVIKEVVNHVNGDRVVSATIGDLPCDPDLLAQRVLETGELGVDLVKVGIFEPDNSRLFASFQRISEESLTGVVIVLFADRLPDWSIVDQIAQAGLAGVMIDTADKSAGSLLDIISLTQIEAFVERAKANKLITGLAGSLRAGDIPSLIGFQPDYLGFRGALCTAHQRQSQLDTQALRQIRQRISEEEAHYGAVA